MTIFTSKAIAYINQVKSELEQLQAQTNYAEPDANPASQLLFTNAYKVIEQLITHNSLKHWLKEKNRETIFTDLVASSLVHENNPGRDQFVPAVFNTQSLAFAEKMLEIVDNIRQNLNSYVISAAVLNAIAMIPTIGKPDTLLASMQHELEAQIRIYKVLVNNQQHHRNSQGLTYLLHENGSPLYPELQQILTDNAGTQALTVENYNAVTAQFNQFLTHAFAAMDKLPRRHWQIDPTHQPNQSQAFPLREVQAAYLANGSHNLRLKLLENLQEYQTWLNSKRTDTPALPEITLVQQYLDLRLNAQRTAHGNLEKEVADALAKGPVTDFIAEKTQKRKKGLLSRSMAKVSGPDVRKTKMLTELANKLDNVLKQEELPLAQKLDLLQSELIKITRAHDALLSQEITLNPGSTAVRLEELQQHLATLMGQMLDIHEPAMWQFSSQANPYNAATTTSSATSAPAPM